MKLDQIETFVVENAPPRHGGRYFIFVKLVTACGIVGYGEIYNATFGPHRRSWGARKTWWWASP